MPQSQAQSKSVVKSAESFTVNVYGLPVVITADTIIATREHFAAIERDCAAEQLKPASERAWSIASHVDVSRYIADCESRALADLAGANDHTLTFVQRAVWIQTGESVPMLS